MCNKMLIKWSALSFSLVHTEDQLINKLNLKELVATIGKQDKVNSYATQCIKVVPICMKLC